MSALPKKIAVLMGGPGSERAVSLATGAGVVKAPRQGSTVGVHIIRNEKDVDAAIADASTYDRELLVEKFCAGRELTVGIVGDQVLPILEIIPKGGFYDFNNKYPFLNPKAGGSA